MLKAFEILLPIIFSNITLLLFIYKRLGKISKFHISTTTEQQNELIMVPDIKHVLILRFQKRSVIAEKKY